MLRRKVLSALAGTVAAVLGSGSAGAAPDDADTDTERADDTVRIDILVREE